MKIRDIGSGGREVAVVWGSGRVREALAECGLALAAGDCEAALEGHLTRRGETVRLHGAIRGRYWVPCSRCLEPAAIAVTERALELCFVPPSAAMDDPDAARERAGERAVEHELELAGEDLEVSSHDGSQIDLEGVLLELLVLALPIAPLCGENCCGPAATVESGHEAPAWKEALARLKS